MHKVVFHLLNLAAYGWVCGFGIYSSITYFFKSICTGLFLGMQSNILKFPAFLKTLFTLSKLAEKQIFKKKSKNPKSQMRFLDL